MTKLFRKEAVERQALPFLGDVLLTQPVSIATGTWAAVTLALVSGLLVSQFRYSNVAFIGGRVELSQEPVVVRAVADGRITQVHILSGAVVKRGDRLFDIESDRPNKRNASPYQSVLGEIDGRIRSERREMVEIARRRSEELAALDHQRHQVDEQQRELTQELAIQQSRVDIRKRNLETYLSLGAYFSGLQVDHQRELLYEQEQRVRQLNRSAADLRGQAMRLVQVRAASVAKHDSDARQSEQRLSELRQLEVEQGASGHATVTAPGDGTIALQNISKEQDVTKGQSVLTLIPTSADPVVALYGKGEAFGQVTPGMQVLMRFDSFPYQRFGQLEGTVESVSPISAYLETGPGGSDSGFRIAVKPKTPSLRDGDNTYQLRPGMTLQASVQLERRTVWEWIVKPRLVVTNQ